MMNRSAWALSGLLLATTALGCAGSDQEAATQEGFDTESNIRVTYNGDLSLLGSYHELFDRGADTACVKYTDGGKHARVSEPARNLSIELVRKKEELAKKMGIDLNMKARYVTVSGTATTNLLDEFSSSSNSVTFLLSASADYVVRETAGTEHEIVLTDGAVNALNQGAAEFSRQCGTHYVNAVRHGGRFYLLITFKAMSHTAKTQMNASLGVDGAISGSGDVKTRLERTASMSGVNVTVKAASSGFWLDGQPSQEVVRALEGSLVDEGLFNAATTLYFAMTQAVEQEYCLDAGEGTCNGQDSPGYYNRSRRDTSVTGIQVGAYHTLSNATNHSAFDQIKERVDVHSRFIRNYSEIQVRMDNIYNDEIKPFLEASPKQKPLFNVAAPGDPKRTPDEVYTVAKALDELIYPPTGGVMGWLREDVQDRIKQCIDKINVDLSASCTSDDTHYNGESPNRELEADETRAWRDLYDFFEDYHNNKRILPLDVAIGESAVTYPNGQAHCDKLAGQLNDQLAEQGSTTRVVYRLPKKDEVRWLAPVVSHGAVSWSGAEILHAIWYEPTGGAQPCGVDYPYYQNEPTTNAAHYGCSVNDYWDDDLVPLCVPASGPVPLMEPQ